MRIPVFILACLLAVSCQATTIFVDADATGANNGSSWADAYTELQSALDAATSGDEVRVAAGTYRADYDVGTGTHTGDRTATFQLINNVVIKGGYAGFGEPEPNVRNVDAYETALSGDLNGDDIGDIDDPSRDENSYHIVTGSGTDETAILDGFTITGGNADGSSAKGKGSGMYNDSGNATLTGCTFSRNSASNDGGGMYNRSSSPTLTYCTFSENSASDGGGMYNYFAGSTLTNCTFSANSASSGGGIKHYYGSSTLTNCILWGNSSQIYNYNGTVVVNYSCIQGGWGGTGEGNIDANPYFADSNTSDYHLRSQAGRWNPNTQNWVQDGQTSPCIDAGDPSGSIGYEPFPNGGVINMGAFGGTEQASKSYFDAAVCQKSIAGDINGDCRVDFIDFAIMAFHWLEDNIP